MGKHKYVGMDIHQASTTVAVHDERGKCVIQSVIETKAATIRDCLRGMTGTVHVAFEEGTQAGWIYEIVQPLVSEVVVCNPRANKPSGNKSDRIDANKLAHLLRSGLLKPVYHGGHGTRKLKELVHNYESVVVDTTRNKNRLKAIFRGRGINCAGHGVYNVTKKKEWLSKIEEPGAQSRAKFIYLLLEALKPLHQEAKKLMLEEARKHRGFGILKSLAGIGPIRAALIIAIVSTPYRFRTRRQFWTYCGFAVVTHTSSDFVFTGPGVARRHKRVATRGLNRNYNRRLKAVFKGAVLNAIEQEPFKSYWEEMKAANKNIDIARVCVARKLAAVALAMWKRGEKLDVKRHQQNT